ncbi:MAG TPA: hypothetical protein PL176_11540 [Kiritimatiellia bacterium]|nr:hypothetical protein [Kiritimatiellia bacterium]
MATNAERRTGNGINRLIQARETDAPLPRGTEYVRLTFGGGKGLMPPFSDEKQTRLFLL